MQEQIREILRNLDSKLSLATIKQSHDLAWEAKEQALQAILAAVAESCKEKGHE